MATIEGNEIALRAVASELIPPVRSNVDARVSQDDAGQPFSTVFFNVTEKYPAASAAPSWVYGFVLEGVYPVGSYGPNGSFDGQAGPINIYVSFGAATQATSPGVPGTGEILVQPGQQILIPRGSRKVYFRASESQATGGATHTIVVTWILDRFATKSSPGTASPLQTRVWQGGSGTGLVNANSTQGTTIVDLSTGYFHAGFGIENGTNVQLTYELKSYNTIIDTGNVAQNGQKWISYGPGVGDLTGNVQAGHGIVLPSRGATFWIYGFNPLTDQGSYAWSYRLF
jgi:hypothetical protein